MSAKILTFTAEVTEFEVSLVNKGLGNFLEIAFDGSIAEGASIGIFRKIYLPNGSYAEIPMTFSWADQTLATITADLISGLTFEGLIADSSIVFKAQNGAVLGSLFLLGIA